MKKLLAMICVMLGCACAANASGENTNNTTKAKTVKLDKKVAAVAEQRATHLSDMMIRDLGLNNYQSRKMREINREMVVDKMIVEETYAGNQAIIDQKCKEICNKRDAQLENVLSTKQYNEYFGDRKIYNKTEKDFMASLNKQQDVNQTASANEAAPATTVSLN